MTKNFFRAITLVLCLTILSPFLGNVTAFAETQLPEIIGESAITMDMNTGEIIYSKNADEKRSPASTTKLLTALIFAETKSKNDVVTYGAEASTLVETTLNAQYMGMSVKPGDTLTADDAMKALLIFSANDVAIAIAETISGSSTEFAKLMNEKAKELGALNSDFKNPHGLEDVENPANNNSTTAYDLAIIAKAAFDNEWIRETVLQDNINITLNGSSILLDTRNKLLNTDGNVGGKTGTETLSGHCFVGYYSKDDKNLATVVLGSEYGASGINVFNDTKAIADYSYTATKVPFKATGEEISNVELQYKLFKFFGPVKTITAPVILNQDVQYYKNDYNDAKANISINAEGLDGWKIASHNDVELTFNAGTHSEKVFGLVQLSTKDILKANLPIYLAALVAIIIIIVLIVVIVKLILKSKRNRGRRYYR